MHMGNLYKHKNSKDSEATLDTEDILGKGEKGGEQGLRF